MVLTFYLNPLRSFITYVYNKNLFCVVKFINFLHSDINGLLQKFENKHNNVIVYHNNCKNLKNEAINEKKEVEEVIGKLYPLDHVISTKFPL